MSYAHRQEIALPKPFKLVRTGHELPAGSYVVNSDVRFLSSQGRTSSVKTNYLEIPYGRLGRDHVGGTVMVTDDELHEAQSPHASTRFDKV